MKQLRITPGHLIFYVSFAIYVAAGLLLYSAWAFSDTGEINTFGTLLKMVRYLVYALCIVKIAFFTDYRRYHFIPVIICVGIVALSVFTSRDTVHIFSALIIISLLDISFEKILKVSFYVSTLVLLITVLFALFGVISDYVREEGDRVRHFLGFSWATYASIILFFIILEYIAMNRGRLNIAETIVLLALGFWLYKMTDARFAFAMELLELAFFFVFGRLFDRKRTNKRLLYHILLLVPWAAAVLSIIIHYLYDPASKFWLALDGILSGRLYNGGRAITRYGIHLLGQNIEWVGFNLNEELPDEYNFVDCSYLREMLRNGMIFLIMILLIMTIIIKLAIDKRDYYLVWIMVFISVFSITEMWLSASLAMDPFLACISIWGTKHMWQRDNYAVHNRLFRYRLKLRRS